MAVNEIEKTEDRKEKEKPEDNVQFVVKVAVFQRSPRCRIEAGYEESGRRALPPLAGPRSSNAFSASAIAAK
jgi:hypothetical protein